MNSKNFTARIDAQVTERFSGELASITKEIAEKGITSTAHMFQPPSSAYEMKVGARSVCEMVTLFRKKEAIASPTVLNDLAVLLPCTGKPGKDDPFPDEPSEQIGTRAIDEANRIELKARSCTAELRAGRLEARTLFAADIKQCCLGEIQQLHYAILSRCPSARDANGERFYQELVQNKPMCDAESVSKYLRELGQSMRDLRWF